MDLEAALLRNGTRVFVAIAAVALALGAGAGVVEGAASQQDHHAATGDDHDHGSGGEMAGSSAHDHRSHPPGPSEGGSGHHAADAGGSHDHEPGHAAAHVGTPPGTGGDHHDVTSHHGGHTDEGHHHDMTTGHGGHPHDNGAAGTSDRAEAAAEHHSGTGEEAEASASGHGHDDEGHGHATVARTGDTSAGGRALTWYDALACYGDAPYGTAVHGHDGHGGHGGHSRTNEDADYRGGTNSWQANPDCPVGVPRLGSHTCMGDTPESTFTVEEAMKAVDIWEATTAWTEERLSVATPDGRVWDQGVAGWGRTKARRGIGPPGSNQAGETAAVGQPGPTEEQEGSDVGYVPLGVPVNWMMHYTRASRAQTRTGEDVNPELINSIIYGLTWEGWRPIGAMYVAAPQSAYFETAADGTRNYDPRVFADATEEATWQGKKQRSHAAARGVYGYREMKAAGYDVSGIPETGTGCILDWHAHDNDAASALTRSDMGHVWTVRAEEGHILEPLTGSHQYGYPNGEFIESPLVLVDGDRHEQLVYDYAEGRLLGADGRVLAAGDALKNLDLGPYARFGPDGRPYRYYFNGMGNPATNRGYGPLGAINPYWYDDCTHGLTPQEGKPPVQVHPDRERTACEGHHHS